MMLSTTGAFAGRIGSVHLYGTERRAVGRPACELQKHVDAVNPLGRNRLRQRHHRARRARIA
jgi:hypothetical protein